ncbi:MAG TPA: formate dehydrogenase subunit delta [Paracoccaceae bacterium]|nr:formate dehydrogenase subunit delta [Paracoccaceae bacterium]
MNVNDLVRMANQIADFNRPYPHEEAVKGVEYHLRSFWDPRMRAALARHLEEGGAGLSELAREGALRACRAAEAA